MDDDEFEEEFQCPACRELMVLPTILPCGHNQCRLCLAKSCFATQRKTCPTCQQSWTGFPYANLALRNMIAKTQDQLLARREHDTLRVGNGVEVIQKFDVALRQAEKDNRDKEITKYLFTGVAITLLTLLVPYSVYYWFTSGGDPVTQKPVAAWRSSDVEQWLDSRLWPQDYIPMVQEHAIDGRMLLGMQELELIHLLNVTDGEHQNAMQTAIRAIREHGVKMPESFWEYKALYPGRCYFFLVCLTSFPRSAVIIFHIFYHDDVFLPLLHSTTPVEWGDHPEANYGKPPEPKMSQLIMFYMWTLLLPYWKFAVFAWSYRWEHYVVLVPVLLHCFLATFYDTHLFLDLFIRGKRMRLWQTFKLTYTFQFLVNAGIFITWPFMPLFVLNFFFYCGLLVSVWIAYKLCRSLVREVREFFNKKQK